MKIRDAIYLLMQKTTDIVRTETVTKDNVTVTGDGVANVNVTIPSINGYKFLGISNVTLDNASESGRYCSFCNVYWQNKINANTYEFRIVNRAATDAKVKLFVPFLMIRGGINPLVSMLSALLRGWRYADKRYALCDLAEDQTDQVRFSDCFGRYNKCRVHSGGKRHKGNINRRLKRWLSNCRDSKSINRTYELHPVLLVGIRQFQNPIICMEPRKLFLYNKNVLKGRISENITLERGCAA